MLTGMEESMRNLGDGEVPGSNVSTSYNHRPQPRLALIRTRITQLVSPNSPRRKSPV